MPDSSAYSQLAFVHAATDQDHNAQFGMAKALQFLLTMESSGAVGMEKNSVYGAAIAVPQIARSCGWPGTMLALAFRTYAFLFINICLQGFLLLKLGETQHFLNVYAGQMHLCDYGAEIEQCPGAPNCEGPGGTQLSFPRLYGFDDWITRTFARDSLKAVFPEQASKIDKMVDPGEYGLESYNCRVVCCFIFMLTVIDDVRSTTSLFYYLMHLPSTAAKWIKYEVPSWAEKDYVKSVHGWNELNFVKFGVAGMPVKWKVVNVCVVILPKLIIWLMLVFCGFHFLMETAGIVDLIMNSMALTFILSLDEMIFDILTSAPVIHMMTNLEDFPLYNLDQLEKSTDEELMSSFQEKEMTSKWKQVLRMMVPAKLRLVVVIMPFFVVKYYIMNCHWTADSSLVSNPLYYPPSQSFNPLYALGIHFAAPGETPSWQNPP